MILASGAKAKSLYTLNEYSSSRSPEVRKYSFSFTKEDLAESSLDIVFSSMQAVLPKKLLKYSNGFFRNHVRIPPLDNVQGLKFASVCWNSIYQQKNR